MLMLMLMQMQCILSYPVYFIGGIQTSARISISSAGGVYAGQRFSL